ncbi:group II intron maturase-specific domain-containing protein [Nonomuraea cavernae]|uniref:group II intron maturase-specific domain-containing protein n=1 Tax=Nonomuraea cavernae TaxID=2045107 RepID=UPI0033C61468
MFWATRRRSTFSERDLARWRNSVVSGWMNCYGRFYRSELYPLLRRINVYLVRWTRMKNTRRRACKGCHAGRCGCPEARFLRATRPLRHRPITSVAIMLCSGHASRRWKTFPADVV